MTYVNKELFMAAIPKVLLGRRGYTKSWQG